MRFITLTHHLKHKIHVNTEYIAAVLPAGVDSSTSKFTKSIVVLSSGLAYHVIENPTTVMAAIIPPDA